MKLLLSIIVVVVISIQLAASFSINPAIGAAITTTTSGSHSTAVTVPLDSDFVETAGPPRAVRAPLKYIGPYPCLALRFPDLQTSNQRARNVSGVSLDFVLDTAANVNTINGQVAQELQLPIVGQALPGVGTAGVILGGNTYMLGDAQLEGLLSDEPFTFMTNLTASALPIASPAAAGLLSLAFLQCFEGGVEFAWGTLGADEPPSITFYSERMDRPGLHRVPVERIPITQLPSIKVVINGIEMTALLDTGSPITVLNAKAASLAGIETVPDPTKQAPKNPLGAFMSRLDPANSGARAGVLTIMGVGGRPVNLLSSIEKVKVDVQGSDGLVDFGVGNIYVGDLPGLAALNGIGVDSPPAVVLGNDVLKRRKNMLLCAQDNVVYFG